MHINLPEQACMSIGPNYCKHPAQSYVVGCKEKGGVLPTVTALTAQGMTIMCLFVVQVIVGTTHGITQYSVNKQINHILNITPSGDRNYQLLDPSRS